MSNLAKQHRSAKRAVKQKAKRLNKPQTPIQSHNNDEPDAHWDDVREISNLLRLSVAEAGQIGHFISDPEIASRMDRTELVEGALSINNDLTKNIIPLLDKFTSDIEKFEGPVKEDQLVDYIEAIQAGTTISSHLNNVLHPQVNALLLEVNDAARKYEEETGKPYRLEEPKVATESFDKLMDHVDQK